MELLSVIPVIALAMYLAEALSILVGTPSTGAGLNDGIWGIDSDLLSTAVAVTTEPLTAGHVKAFASPAARLHAGTTISSAVIK